MAIPTRVLGRTGFEVTVLGYGAMELRGVPRGPEVSDEGAVHHQPLGAGSEGGFFIFAVSVRQSRLC